MTDFCGPLQNTDLTNEDILGIYSDGITPSILGSVQISDGQRDGTTGLILPTALAGIVENLQSKGVLPKPPSMTNNANQNKIVNQFMKDEAAAIDNIKKEYCFYASRYVYVLNQLIAKLQAGFGSTSDDNKKQVNKQLKVTITLNHKLNDITQVVNEFTKLRLAQSQSYNKSINSLNKNLVEKSKALAGQNAILKSGQTDALLYKEMVKYTKEKSNYTVNMLALYSFLNITAIGLLFYAYTTAEE